MSLADALQGHCYLSAFTSGYSAGIGWYRVCLQNVVRRDISTLQGILWFTAWHFTSTPSGKTLHLLNASISHLNFIFMSEIIHLANILPIRLSIIAYFLSEISRMVVEKFYTLNLFCSTYAIGKALIQQAFFIAVLHALVFMRFFLVGKLYTCFPVHSISIEKRPTKLDTCATWHTDCLGIRKLQPIMR